MKSIELRFPCAPRTVRRWLSTLPATYFDLFVDLRQRNKSCRNGFSYDETMAQVKQQMAKDARELLRLSNAKAAAMPCPAATWRVDGERLILG